MKPYQNLFYHFSDKPDPDISPQMITCNLCSEPIIASSEKHIITKCRRLRTLKQMFFQNVYKKLANIIKEYDSTHQYIFAQNVMQMFYNLATQRDNTNNTHNTFWKIISGCNFWCSENENFRININIKQIQTKEFKFLKHLISYIHQYVYIVTNIKLNKANRIKWERKYNLQQINHIRIPLILETFQQWKIFKQQFITYNDIIISTDGSFDNNVSGIGIYAKNYNNNHYWSQPIGWQSIQFAEIYALAKIPILLKHF